MKNKPYPYCNVPDMRDIKDMIFRNAQEIPDKTAFVYPCESGEMKKTFLDLKDDVVAFGSWMYSKKLTDKRVAIVGENSYEWLVIYMATICGGSVSIAIDKSLPEDEIAGLAKLADVDTAFISDTYFEKVGKKICKKSWSMKEFEDILSEGRKIVKDGGANEFIDYELEPELLRKYIAYARKNVNPQLTDEANEILKEFYVSTRNSNPEEQGPVPITARQLEAIIRLAEASAKIKLKETVDKEDAEKAVKLTMACLKEVGVDPETGEIDADIVGGGTPKSDRDKIQRVTDEIKYLEEEYAGNAPLNVLLSNMSDKYGVSEDKTEQIVRNLIQKGVIYEPTNGYFRRVV